MLKMPAVLYFVLPLSVVIACSKGPSASPSHTLEASPAPAEPAKADSAAPKAPATADASNATPSASDDGIDDLSLWIQGAAATDPGIRSSSGGAGQPLASLTSAQLNYFNAGLEAFTEVDSVSGQLPGETGTGLGPGFNARSCAECHAYPSVGGSSPLLNPQIADAKAHGAANSVPFFITARGPVREVRFKYLTNANGTRSTTRDGGVHDIFSIAGRSDAGACDLPQPDFNSAYRANNLSYRIPTPTFGAGLIESISDGTILKSHDQSATLRQIWGISGHPNTSGNDGTITRFGWKAQNKSLMIFAGEAYNVEQGVTNELFPNERVTNHPACILNKIPEDHTNFDESSPLTAASDVVRFAAFMRMLAPPHQGPVTSSVARGAILFDEVACSLCHTPALPISGATVAAQSAQQTAQLYSDLMVHHMGAGLADDIIQGAAGGDEFRSAPLWGLGQRAFFLHDGRTSDLMQAIIQHASHAASGYQSSEANLSVQRFLGLPRQSQQDLVNFLRSL